MKYRIIMNANNKFKVQFKSNFFSLWIDKSVSSEDYPGLDTQWRDSPYYASYQSNHYPSIELARKKISSLTEELAKERNEKEFTVVEIFNI